MHSKYLKMALLGELAASVLLFCLVFGMSATVEMKSLKKQIRNRTALLIGVVMQFLVLPFVGFCVVKILQLPSTYGVTLLVITSSPGGSYSNWWCSLFNAELALSVTMTTISTLLSVVMLPVNLILYTRWTYSEDVVGSLDWSALILSLIVVISGIGGGLYSSYRAEQRGDKARFHKTANRLGNVAGILLVILSVVISSTGNNDHHKASLWDQDARFYIGVALPAILGLLLAVKMSSHYELEKPERVAVAVEACYQNTGIATSVAISLYDGDDLATAIGVPLYYGIVEAVLLAFFCMVCWKMGWTKAPPEENCCKVIYNSYEGHEEGEGGENNLEGTANSKREGAEVPMGASNDESGEFVGTGDRKRIVGDSAPDGGESVVTETEMTETSGSGVVVQASEDGAVAVVSGNEGELPQQVSGFDRVMATVRARVAGYGFGQQDEERGLRTRRGPVTLGLSQVASPRDKKRKKKKKTSQEKNKENDLPLEGRSID